MSRYILGLFFSLVTLSAEKYQQYDLVIYGGTSAAVIAAVQAKKMGKTVIIVSPDKHLGGLSSGGLGFTDSGDKSVIGGLSRNFYHRVWEYYQAPETWVFQKREAFGNKGQGTVAMDQNERTMWIFEPHIAEKVFEDYVKEFQLVVDRDEWLDRAHGVEKNGTQILSFKTLSGKIYHGKMFIDATYEGDLMAAAGVHYTVGREANAQYHETLNGVQVAHSKSHQFEGKIDPYVIPGDPSSGLLPKIQPGSPGVDGEADSRIQAYNYRMCLTKVPENRIPFAAPPGYNPKQYALLARTLQAKSQHVFGKFDAIPNGKTDTNNHGSFSTDNIGMNYDYPEASYERRREILAEHFQYQAGYFYFISHDPSVPAVVREKFAEWGLAADEFKDNHHWPHQIYVREARRMVSDFVLSELHLRRQVPTPHSVGMGSYNMDSHNTQRYVAKDAEGRAYVRNEGDVEVNPGGPYPIDYGSIIPKAAECTNLVVPVCVSSTHIAYGSVRMEPVFMILGQSAATAAMLALDKGVKLQDLPYAELQKHLLEQGQVLESSRRSGATGGASMKITPKDIPGITVDDQDAKLVGEWTKSTASALYVGEGYQHDGKGAHGLVSARFETTLPEARSYEVFLAIVPNANRATNAPVQIHHADGVAKLQVDLTHLPGGLSDKGSKPLLLSLGIYKFTPNQPAAVVVSNEGANGFVVIDAVNWQAR
jgi:hypothetical protein